MKIYVSYNEDNHDMIRAVQTEEFYKGRTQEEIDEAIKKTNAAAGYEKFKCFNVPEELVNVFLFALGEGAYKIYKDMTNLYNVLGEIKDNLEDIQRDCYDVCETLEWRLKEVKELVPEDER